MKIQSSLQRADNGGREWQAELAGGRIHIIVERHERLTLRRSIGDDTRLAGTTFPDDLWRDRIVIARPSLTLNDGSSRDGTTFPHRHGGRGGHHALMPGCFELVLYQGFIDRHFSLLENKPMEGENMKVYLTSARFVAF